MKFLLSGEGATDFGVRAYDGTFQHGPMTLFVDILVEPLLGYSIRQSEAFPEDGFEFRSREALSARGRPKGTKLPGKRYGSGGSFFRANAQVLGQIALERTRSEDCTFVAILFRDGDGSRSKDEWEDKRLSIERGFELAGFEYGVPMVPKPKSEAWLLQAHQSHSSPHETYEGMTGSRNSNTDLKRTLTELVTDSSREHLVALIEDGIINPLNISDACMSFSVFKDTLRQKVRAAQNDN
jgi:hypothetical protein